LAKKSTESSKVSNVDEIPMTDAGATLQDNEPLIDVVAAKVTVGVHTSVDTFFVAGKEYVASSSIDPSVPTPTSHEDSDAIPYIRGSADIHIDSCVQELPDDPLEELVISQDPSVDTTRVCDDDLVSEEERLEQERLLKEWEDKKKSTELAKELQAKYDSKFQSAINKYVSTLPLARQRDLDAAIPNFDEADWMHIRRQVVSNPGLARDILGGNVNEVDYVPGIVELMKQRRKAEAERIAKAKRDKPMTQAQQRNYMRDFVKSQSSALYKKQVWSLSDEQLIHQYNRIKTRLQKDGIITPKLVPTLPITDAEPHSKRLKMDEVAFADVPAASLSFSADAVSTIDMDVPAVANTPLPSVSTSTDPTTAVAPSVIDKGKAKVVAEDIPSNKITIRQMEEDRLGEEAAKRLHADQQADLARFHEIKVREVELAAARAKQVRMEMDANASSVSLDQPSAEVSADVPLVSPSVEIHESEDVSTEEPSSPHAAIYIPGRRAKRMARMKVSQSSQVHRVVDVDAVDSSFIKEGSPDD
jgi:hypothetical protein